MNTALSCAMLLAKPLGIAWSGLTHEVPLRDLHRLLSLHDVEAYWSAVEATGLSVIMQLACFGIKGSRLKNSGKVVER
jgi:hypothetical protein